MRNVRTAAGLTVLGMMLAAGPEVTPFAAVLAERTVSIRLPRSAADPVSVMDGETHSILARAAGSSSGSAVVQEATTRVTIPHPYSTQWYVSGTDESIQSGEIVVQLRVNRLGREVGFGPSVGEANKLADEMVNVTRERVAREWDRTIAGWKENQARGQREAATAADRLAKARGRMAAGEKTLREQTGRIDLSAVGMQAAQDALELERQKVELDLAGLKARQVGLQEAIAAQAMKAEAARNDDPAVQALTKAVAASKAQLAQVQALNQSGQASTAEVTQAELAMLQAQARLAERANAAGGAAEAMAQWNRALTDATIELREKEARLGAATKRLTALIDAAAQQKELDAARAEATEAAEQLARAEARAKRATEWLERYGEARPVIEVRLVSPTTVPAAH